MSNGWDRYLVPQLTEEQRAIHAVLHKWFEGVESGECKAWLPRPDYPKVWSEHRISDFLKEMDEYCARQASWVANNRHIIASEGPGYQRLAPAQRLAFMQDLHDVLLRFAPED